MSRLSEKRDMKRERGEPPQTDYGPYSMGEIHAVNIILSDKFTIIQISLFVTRAPPASPRSSSHDAGCAR